MPMLGLTAALLVTALALAIASAPAAVVAVLGGFAILIETFLLVGDFFWGGDT